ncbi:MAG: ABC transporter permease, partial [Clostridiales bacterium]|nr:ABC transporter permease [Clostridiales bacterium]
AERAVSQSNTYIRRASDYLIELQDGQAVYAGYHDKSLDVPLGENVELHGMDFELSAKYDVYSSCAEHYEDWMSANGYSRIGETEFISALIPDGSAGDDFADVYEAYYQAHYFEYLDYYYEYYADFLKFAAVFGSGDTSQIAWLFAEKNVQEAYRYLTDTDGYYYACEYKAQNGAYPTAADAQENFWDYTDRLGADIALLMKDSYQEYFKFKANMSIGNACFYVTDADYIRLSKSVGNTHPVASPYFWKEDAVTDVPYGGFYMLVHSSSPRRTADFLNKLNSSGVIAPDDVKKMYSSDIEIMPSLIALAVVVVLLSLCMYFIMRSSLMSRIKEIGIYRAIGVSKKNLVFKFFVEAFLLTTLTVVIGYLLMSAFL